VSISWREITNTGAEVMAYKLWEDIGLNIAKARKASGMTCAELSNRIGCPESRIERYEYAETKVNLAVLEKLSKCLDVSVDWLIDAKFDSPDGECLYSIGLMGRDHDPRYETDQFKFWAYATSARMAFFKINEMIRLAGRRFVGPGVHAYVELRGTPITKKWIESSFPRKADDDEPIEKD